MAPQSQALGSPVTGRGRAQPLSISSTALVAVFALLAAQAPPPVAAHVYPYFPTQILAPNSCFNQSACDAADLAYVFTQNIDNSVQFLSLNISTTVGGVAGTQIEQLTNSLPFLGGGGDNSSPDTAFGAARAGDGTLVVYAGSCSQGPPSVWTYGEGDNATWVQKTTATENAQSPSRGPYFLGGTVAFSATLAPSLDQPTIYSYGGMCATPQDNSTDWQSAANYTKTMISLTPLDNNDAESDSYTLGVASSAGPWTPLAGFSLTQLGSSMSNISGTVTQQAAYVVLGGHTQQAFINISTAAVWSLPEESWSYVTVQQPDSAASSVDSRSGHTAVLSEDGRSIVVLGGWVGDVGSAAEPQLAVLEMNQTYYSWRWTVPDQQPNFGADGIYGHGAALLPGNVMMVYGGWQINPSSSSSSSRMRRQTGSTASSPQFLNLTSMTWSTSYDNPNASTSKGNNPNAASSGTQGTSSKSQQLGLGLGLGLGLALIAALIAFFYWRAKQRERRAARDETIRAMAQDASLYIHDGDEMAERDDSLPWGYDGWYTGGQDPYRTGLVGERPLGYESLAGSSRGSYGGYAPVVPGIARKPVPRQLRGAYGPLNTQLTSLISPPGQIHPIMEDDEEDLAQQRINPNDVATPTSEAHSDPFLTPVIPTASGALPITQTSPTRSSATPSPESHRPYDPDVQDWAAEVDTADVLLARYNSRQGQGQVSPTRRNSHRSSGLLRDDDSRTGSGLSDSNRSATDSLNRSHSGRWSNIAAGTASLFGGAALMASGELGHVNTNKPGSSSSSSYNTARSGFGALQAEGPSLLLGRTSPTSPFEDEDVPPEPGSPSKSKPRRSWLGSLKRVFSGSESTTGASSLREDDSPQRPSMDMLGADYEAPLAALGGELLRRKQGRQDWEGGNGTSAEKENEWDIEKAVEQRLVQVMFTVPKERLRVVNADDDDGQGGEDEKPALHQPQTAELVDPDRSYISQESIRSGIASHHHNEDDEEGGGAPVVASGRGSREDEYEEYFDDTDSGFLRLEPGGYDERRFSHSTDTSLARSLAAAVFNTAETMTLERPKTRVLQMVDSIESRSKDHGSPTESSRGGSPVRSMKSKKSLRSIGEMDM